MATASARKRKREIQEELSRNGSCEAVKSNTETLQMLIERRKRRKQIYESPRRPPARVTWLKELSPNTLTKVRRHTDSRTVTPTDSKRYGVVVSSPARHRIQPVLRSQPVVPRCQARRCPSPAKSPRVQPKSPASKPKPGRLRTKTPSFKLGRSKPASPVKCTSPDRGALTKQLSTASARRLSLTPMKSLRSSLRSRVTSSLRKQALRGMHDYSSIPGTGDVQYLQFLMAIDDGETSHKDQDLQQKIDHEIKMRDGTAKLLAASKHPPQMLEAAKSLLTSNARMMAYMSELQRRKTEEVLKSKSWLEGNQLPCKAKVCVSDLRIPLMWRDTDHFKNKGDHRRYAVFCLWKLGTEVYDTSLIKEVDRNMTDLTFKDVFVFNDVPHNFECNLEVYCHKLFDDVSIASSSKKLRKKMGDLGSQFGRSVGKRLSGLKEDPDITANMIVGPKYDQVAHGKLQLGDVRDAVTTFDLILETPNTSEPNAIPELPLFGNFCCRMVAQPHCLVQETASGKLCVTDCKHSHTENYWCVLQGLKISCWLQEEQVNVIEPTFTIPVTKDTQLSEGLGSGACRTRTILIATHGCHTPQYILEAPCQAVHACWWDGLQQHLLDQVLWQHACDKKMEIKTATPEQIPSYLRKGSLSLYDEVSCSDTPVKQAQLNKRNSPVMNIINRIQSLDEGQPQATSKAQGKKSPLLKDTNKFVYSKSLDVDSLCSSNDSLATNSSDDPNGKLARKESSGAADRQTTSTPSPGPPVMRKMSSKRSLDRVTVTVRNSADSVQEGDVDAGYSTSTTDGSSVNLDEKDLAERTVISAVSEESLSGAPEGKTVADDEQSADTMVTSRLSNDEKSDSTSQNSHDTVEFKTPKEVKGTGSVSSSGGSDWRKERRPQSSIESESGESVHSEDLFDEVFDNNDTAESQNILPSVQNEAEETAISRSSTSGVQIETCGACDSGNVSDKGRGSGEKTEDKYSEKEPVCRKSVSRQSSQESKEAAELVIDTAFAFIGEMGEDEDEECSSHESSIGEHDDLEKSEDTTSECKDTDKNTELEHECEGLSCENDQENSKNSSKSSDTMPELAVPSAEVEAEGELVSGEAVPVVKIQQSDSSDSVRSETDTDTDSLPACAMPPSNSAGSIDLHSQQCEELLSQLVVAASLEGKDALKYSIEDLSRDFTLPHPRRRKNKPNKVIMCDIDTNASSSESETETVENPSDSEDSDKNGIAASGENGVDSSISTSGVENQRHVELESKGVCAVKASGDETAA